MHVYLRKGYVHGKTKNTHTKKKKKKVLMGQNK